MSKLANGHFLASLTSAITTFGVVSGNLPEVIAGEAPDTSTNSNTTYRSIGKGFLVKLGDFEIECAFEVDQYSDAPTWVGTNDTLATVVEDGSTIGIPVYVNSYKPTGFESDGFPTATVSFSVDTGEDGDTGLTVVGA